MERTEPKRKNIGWIGLVCLNLLLFLNAGGQPIRLDIQQKYSAEVGTREATGNNDGARVESYLHVTGIGKGNPWCAAFVAWTFLQCNVPAPKSAYSPDWFKKNVVYKQSWQKDYIQAKPGMVFGLYFPSKGRVAHVGFIDGEDKHNYYTIEGNTNAAGSREGDGVYRKMRPKSSVYIISDPVLSAQN